jgi:hypothetical protein
LQFGADIPTDKIETVIRQINEAMIEDRYFDVHKCNKRVGFLTCQVKDGKVFVNNCVIFKDFRGPTTLMTIRNTLRKIYDNPIFYWKSRRRDKLCFAK